MNYLLDTCALLWLAMGGGDLTPEVRRRISVAAQLFYSPISLWEVTRLQKEGKIILPNTPDQFIADLIDAYGLSSIPPSDDVMIRAAQLPDHHRDPADRMIIATALMHDLIVVTGDGRFAQYGVRTVC